MDKKSIEKKDLQTAMYIALYTSALIREERLAFACHSLISILLDL